MKLKELLCAHFINRYEGYDLTEKQIYLAGFEKAREMALDRLNKHPDHNTRYAEDDAISNMGEEEVE